MTVFTYYVLGRGRNTLYISNLLIVTTTLIIQTQFTNEEIRAQERSPKYTEDQLIQADSQSCCSVSLTPFFAESIIAGKTVHHSVHGSSICSP